MIILRSALTIGRDGKDSAQVSWSEPPYVEVGQLVPICLNHCSHALRHGSVGAHIEQHSARVSHQAIGPNSDDDGTTQTRDRVHPYPPKKSTERQADDNKHRDCRIRQDMNDGSAHIVITMRCAVRVLMFLEIDRVGAAVIN